MRTGFPALLCLALLTCAPTPPKPPPQATQLNGHVFNRAFGESRAGFHETGNPPSAVIRVMELADIPRDDACEGATDPSAILDPTLLLSITPSEPGTYPVIVTTDRFDGGPPARFATAQLFTFEDIPDGGLPDGQVPRPVVRNAVGGEVKVTALDPEEGGRLNADVILEFPDGEAYSGKIGAVPCDSVQ